MTDLQHMTIMLSKSNECFEKTKSGDDWKLLLKGRNVEFYFDQNGEFKFLCQIRH